MNIARNHVIVAFAVVLAVAGSAWLAVRSRSQQEGPRKIGILQLTRFIDAFPDGMRDGMASFGYRDGEDVVYLYENIEQDVSKADGVIRKFVAEDVDVIFAITNPTLAEGLRVTKAMPVPTPIVFVGVDKPVETGLIAGFSSSGNNATGIMGSVTENVARQLALLREINPEARRVGIFGKGFTIEQGLGGLVIKELYEKAPQFGMEVVEYKTDVPPETPALEKEFLRIAGGVKKGDIDAILHVAGHWHATQQFLEFDLAERLGIVTLMPTVEEVEDGGVIGYAPDLYAVGRDSAVIIDKILRGAKPEDVPVEYPRHNVLWVNLDAARRNGIVVPDSVLTKADRRLGE